MVVSSRNALETVFPYRHISSMKVSLVLISLIASACAAPAVVWKKNEGDKRFLHSSENVPAGDMLKDALEGSDFSVVFLVGKDEDGSESLTDLASSGKLPATQAKYGFANVYHHVSGVESPVAIAREAAKHTEHRVLSISMSELNRKLNPVQELQVDEAGAVTSKAAGKRARQLAAANVLIVNVSPKEEPAEIDRTISNAIDNQMVQSVVLAGIRSLQEVKRERMLTSQNRRSIMQKEGERVMDARRRRLEENDAEANNNDLSGVYYVAMTPNILAGILFLGLFTLITWIGISCMGDITGQEVFVSKMPSIGREA
jgi:hypothetical protein